MRGWAGRVLVEIAAGTTFELEFYDPVRFAQSIATELEQQPAVALSNVIVVASVTRSSIRDAVMYLLFTTDYFSSRAIAKAPDAGSQGPELDKPL
jgi:hypothetical protein